MTKRKYECFVSWLLWMRKKNDLNHLDKKAEKAKIVEKVNPNFRP